MTDRRLEIDFLRTRPRLPRAGLLVLFASLPALVVAGIAGRDVVSRMQEQSARSLALDRLEREGELAHGLRQKPSAAELARQGADSKIRRALGTPWKRLLGDLESVASAPVSLRSLESAGATRSVAIGGEAADADALVDYVEALERLPSFSAVALVSHQSQPDQPGRPVAFQLRCEWRIEP